MSNPDIALELLGRGEALSLSLRSLYYRWGYEPYKMSRFEPYDFYARMRSFVSGDHILTFTDTDGRLLALKPDVTLSIVQTYRQGERKVCYHESVYRDNGASRQFREILQVGLERLGHIDLYTQYEVLYLALESMRQMGKQYILDIASVSFITALERDAGIPRGDTERLLHAVQEKNTVRVRRLCAEMFLEEDVAKIWENLAVLYGPLEQTLPQLREMCLDRATLGAWSELQSLYTLLCQSGIPDVASHLYLDFSIIPDLTYYNGLMFQGNLPDVHTAVLSGGRYDSLLRQMGKTGGAIGFAVYLNELEDLPGLPTLDGASSRESVCLTYDAQTAPDTVLAKALELQKEGLRTQVLPAQPDTAPKLRHIHIPETGGIG